MGGLKTYREIILAMVRTGIFGYGGGPSVIPLIRYEAVIRYHWMEEEEFGEVLALGNALPGPIATKMAAYIGYRQKRIMGAIVAVLAHILPTSIAMVALLGALYALRHSPIVSGMIAAVRPVIAVMLGQMTYEFAEKSWKGLGKWVAVGFGFVAFLMLSVWNIHPALVVALFLIYGSFHLMILSKIKEAKESRKGTTR